MKRVMSEGRLFAGVASVGAVALLLLGCILSSGCTRPSVAGQVPTGEQPAAPTETAAKPEAPAPEPAPKAEAPAPQPAAVAETPAPAPVAETPAAVPVKEAPAPAPAKEEAAPSEKAPEPAKPSEAELRAAAEERARRERELLAKQFPADAAAWTLSDFESGKSDWRVEAWGNSGALAVVDKDGSKQLQVTLEAGLKDKAYLGRLMKMDCASRGKVLVDVDNATGEKLGVALAIITDQWYETPIIQLEPGANKDVTFDLKAANFKAASTEWKHTASLKDADKPKSIDLLFYTNKAGQLCIDNVRLLKSQD